jgi:hypothetical protein
MPSCEFVTGARFQVSFELLRIFEGFEGRVELQPPWSELGGVRATTGIVLSQALFEVGGVATVRLRCILNTLENVSVKHSKP